MAFHWESGTMVLCSTSGAGLCEIGAGTGVTSAWRKVQRVPGGEIDMMTRCHHGGECGEH